MSTTHQNIPRKKEWDDIYATFYWNIKLDLNHPENSIEVMSGYSKKNGQSEAADKEQMLKRKIVNLYLHGYFKRMKSFEIKMRAGEFIDKRRDPVIMILKPTEYSLPELNYDYTYKNFGTWLHEFYYRIQNGKDMATILPPTKKNRGNADDFLNIHARNHSTEAHLYAYAARLSRAGQASGAVNDYIRKYKDLKRWV